MTRATELPNLAPASLPRQQRRCVNRELHQLLRRNGCSICGKALAHNSTTASGFDAEGTTVVAGECCFNRLVVIFGLGLVSHRRYDFLPTSTKPGSEPSSNERIIAAIAAYRQAIA